MNCTIHRGRERERERERELIFHPQSVRHKLLNRYHPFHIGTTDEFNEFVWIFNIVWRWIEKRWYFCEITERKKRVDIIAGVCFRIFFAEPFHQPSVLWKPSAFCMILSSFMPPRPLWERERIICSPLTSYVYLDGSTPILSVERFLRRSHNSNRLKNCMPFDYVVFADDFLWCWQAFVLQRIEWDIPSCHQPGAQHFV